MIAALSPLLTHVGPSEYAIVLGAKPSKVELWNQKFHHIKLAEPEWLTNMADCGREFEFATARLAAKLLGRDPNLVEKFDTRVEYAGRRWGRYSLDPVLVSLKDPVIFECKARSSWSFSRQGWGTPFTDQVPLPIFIQCQGQLEAIRADRDHYRGTNIPEVDRIHVAVSLGNEVRIYVVHYEPDLARGQVEACEKFWRDHVEAGICPPWDGSEAAQAVLQQEYPKASKDMRDPTPIEVSTVEDLLALKEEIKRLETETGRLEQVLSAAIGPDLGIETEDWAVKWSNRKGYVGHKEVAEALARRLNLSAGELKGIQEFHRQPDSRTFTARRHV